MESLVGRPKTVQEERKWHREGGEREDRSGRGSTA